MNSLVFLRRPDVPGFCPEIGAVATVVGFNAPSPVASLTSSAAFSIFPDTNLDSSDLLVIETSPTKRVDLPIRMTPFTVRRLQSTRDGTPSTVASSSAPSSLYFLESRLMTGATPQQAGLRTGR